MNEEIDVPAGMPMTMEISTAVNDMPVRVQQILALMACGFSEASISKLCNTSTANVTQLINRYDPERKFTLTHEDRRAFLSKLWEARGGEALLLMTPAKLEACDAVELSRIAGTAAKAVATLGTRDKHRRPPVGGLLEGLGARQISEGAQHDADGDPHKDVE